MLAGFDPRAIVCWLMLDEGLKRLRVFLIILPICIKKLWEVAKREWNFLCSPPLPDAPPCTWGDSSGGHRGKGPTERINCTKDIKQTSETESDPCMPDSAQGQSVSEYSAISEEQVRAKLTSVLQYGFHPTTQKCCHFSAIQPSKMLRS